MALWPPPSCVGVEPEASARVALKRWRSTKFTTFWSAG